MRNAEIHGRIEDGRMYLEVRCDGDYKYMLEMMDVLHCIGCTDLNNGEYMVDDVTPSWMDCVYWANGKLPKGEINV